MANFRESINALKEAGLADSEILEIMSDSVDGQMNTKTLAKTKKSGNELPTKDSNINAETLSVRKRKTGAFSAEKHPKSICQGSPGLSWEREEVPFDYPFNRTVSPLSVTDFAFQLIWMKHPN